MGMMGPIPILIALVLPETIILPGVELSTAVMERQPIVGDIEHVTNTTLTFCQLNGMWNHSTLHLLLFPSTRNPSVTDNLLNCIF